MIDTHLHFWRYDPAEFAWIPADWAAIRADFGPEQLHRLMLEHRIDSCIAVQARQSLDETHMLLSLARDYAYVDGVVGWLPLTAASIDDTLQSLAAHHALVGARHVLQAEPPAFFENPALQHGLRSLAQHGLVFDLLVTQALFPQTLALVDRHPQLTFVLDHLGKPTIPRGDLSAWRSGLRELARRPNVTCKISAGVTEIDPRWSPSDLTPLLDEALQTFGPRRLMFGSNWPVCLATGGFERWLDLLQRWSEALSHTDRSWLFELTARSVYLSRKTS